MLLRKSYRKCLKITAVFLICFFTFQTVFTSTSFAQMAKQNLSPVSRINPVVTIEKKEDGSGYLIRENEEELKRFNEKIKEDKGFIYLCLLIGQAIEMGISPVALREMIDEQLLHVDFTRFKIDEIYKSPEDGAFCLPYERENEPVRQTLKFYSTKHKEVNPLESILMKVGDVEVVLVDPLEDEAKAEKLEEARRRALVAQYTMYKNSFPPRFHTGAQELLVEVKIKSVEKKGVIMLPDEKKEKFILNAGVLDINDMRLLFARRATVEVTPGKKTGDSGIRRSEIGLFLHDIEKGDMIEIDREMILPDGEEIIALEDARVIERDGKIYVYVTAVNPNGFYYSAVLTHRTEEFLEILKKRLYRQEDVPWNWSEPKPLITDPIYSQQANKNFVLFGNPVVIEGEEYWCATYRPAEKIRRTMRLVISKTGLDGTWVDVGLYKEAPEGSWLGASAFVAEVPAGKTHPALNFLLYHNARMRTDEEGASEGIAKYYDIAMIVTDREDPNSYYTTEPFLVPERDQPYEMDGWVPGAIYSCGAIMTEFDEEKDEYTFDIYYSGSDTAVLLATVTMEVKQIVKTPLQKKGEALTLEAREEFENILETAEGLEKTYDSEEAKSVAEDEKAERKATSFLDELKIRAYRAKQENEEIIFALDTSWMSADAMQLLLSEVYRISKNEKLNNIVIVRGKGAELAAELLKEQESRSVKLSNIIVMGAKSTIQDVKVSAQAKFKDSAMEDKALLISVDSKNLTDHSYVNILDMIQAAFKIAFSDVDSISINGVQAIQDKHNPRLWTFVPDARAMDLGELRELIEAETQALVSA